LVLQSTTKHIGSLDAKQLKTAVRRSRTLRDKWRDLANSQTRDTKATNPDKLGDANARSVEKATLFDEALTRFEKRLSKLDVGTAKVSPVKKGAVKVDHRADRAAVSETLNVKTETLNASTTRANSAVKATPVKKKSATKSSAAVTPPATKKGAPKKKAPAKPVARKSKPVSANGLAAAQLAAAQAPATSDKLTGSEKKRNLKAKTTAKETAVARSGSPRIQGHVSSQGRRNQAKRNSR
jgi:hypothetical protein